MAAAGAEMEPPARKAGVGAGGARVGVADASSMMMSAMQVETHWSRLRTRATKYFRLKV